VVRPDQLVAFEDFAYDYFYNTREPKVFPNTTATSPFGRGIWGMQPNLTTGEKERYSERERHLNGTFSSWNSSHQILAPILAHNEGPFPALMLNLHFEPTRGMVIDAMMDCAQARTAEAFANEKEVFDEGYDNVTDTACGVITDMLELTSQEEGTGPGALIMPANLCFESRSCRSHCKLHCLGRNAGRCIRFCWYVQPHEQFAGQGLIFFHI